MNDIQEMQKCVILDRILRENDETGEKCIQDSYIQTQSHTVIQNTQKTMTLKFRFR